MAIGDLASKGYVQNFVSSLIKKMIDGKKISDGKHKYSTEEQIVGEWIDGKPIYEKTVIIPNVTKNTYTVIPNITNAENIINYSGSLAGFGVSARFVFGKWVTVKIENGLPYYFNYDIDLPKDMIVYIQYTKTTD